MKKNSEKVSTIMYNKKPLPTYSMVGGFLCLEILFLNE